nr:FAD-dependent oxidoreductase [Paracoccaceae bacterium]
MKPEFQPRLPVAVIGAGPVGLAAAARLVERGVAPLILERGPEVGRSLLAWGHVRVFSPWSFNIDAAARALLEPTGWRSPDPAALPTGAEIVRDYLGPLAAHPAIAPHLVLGARVEGVTRRGLDKLGSAGRRDAPFVLRWRGPDGAAHAVHARAVIDASGTWDTPNPIGVDGLPVPGETEAAERIAYGVPDSLGRDRALYANRRILVIGAGHSAINVALDLLRLEETARATRVVWALRSAGLDRLRGGGLDDRLPERGALGTAAMRAIETGRLTLLAPFAAERIEAGGRALAVAGTLNGQPHAVVVDRIIVATGFRPDFAMLRELRIALDPAIEAPPALAPLIDPNLHSCGTVPPHGAAELAHPEPGFYIVGAKSYGRAPTFLMATGYEQVRSVVARIAGDHVAAREVHLVLPETGVCNTVPVVAAIGCCGGPAPADADACCLLDAKAKAAGRDGCGCGGSRSAD